VRGYLVLLAASGCVSEVSDYPVLARAELHGGDVTGPIEVLGTLRDGGEISPYIDRTLAAYRVKLPDAAPRRVVIYDQAWCDPPADEPPVRADLDEIRKVGDESHFFVRDLTLHDHHYAVDIGVVYAQVSLFADADNYIVGKIVVLRGPDGEDGAPGPWLACGQFVRSEAP
jgi:hypothetical protein